VVEDTSKNSEPKIYLEDVMELYDAGERTVYRWMKERGMPYHQPGGKGSSKIFYFRSELLDWSRVNGVAVASHAGVAG